MWAQNVRIEYIRERRECAWVCDMAVLALFHEYYFFCLFYWPVYRYYFVATLTTRTLSVCLRFRYERKERRRQKKRNEICSRISTESLAIFFGQKHSNWNIILLYYLFIHFAGDDDDDDEDGVHAREAFGVSLHRMLIQKNDIFFFMFRNMSRTRARTTTRQIVLFAKKRTQTSTEKQINNILDWRA